ncbi:MAG: putative transposase [bacterium]
MKRDLAIWALTVVIGFRSPPKGYIHHADRSSQCSWYDYQKILRRHGFTVSKSKKGHYHDNAAVETFLQTIKAELIWRHTWETR